ncbi:MAG: NrpR regulatory domain-containing protein [Methanobrevibacter sp.]|jgi:repressor of nif and glnA expression|nr:NrpR regulatory domain-containing protein [Candidatus Methanoflexus mossambicus]
MLESEQKLIEILRILNDSNKPIGSKILAELLQDKGYNLGERAVRYHLKVLDEKGFTKRVGYSGREITKLGVTELRKGFVYDQVNFIFSKFEEMIYKTTFDYKNLKGNVVLNKSILRYDEEAMKIVKEVFDNGISVSPFVDINKFKHNTDEYIEIKTLCGTTIDGILLNEGIPTIPTYGGLVKIEDYAPIRFEHLISLKETSISPIEAFLSNEMTSVLDVLRNGQGLIPANFRLIPSSAKEKTEQIISKLLKKQIGGVLSIGEDGENILGAPVSEGMCGIAIVGGISPFCAALESGHEVTINLAGEISPFSNLNEITKSKKTIIKNKKSHKTYHNQSVLNKAMNIMQKVDFNLETHKGNLITNISYLKSENLNDAIEIMNKAYKENSKYISPFYKTIDNPNLKSEYDKGIATICSLSLDGILINNGIMSTPKYGGLLEKRKDPKFIELISYTGSSIDPHEIYIFKNMTNITGKKNNEVNTNVKVQKNEKTKKDEKNEKNKAILASVKEIPYIAREKSLKILENIKEVGIPIIKIGKPQEVIFNSMLAKYSFGIVTSGGLNPIAAIHENKIDIKAKAVESISKLSDMEKLG